MGARAVDVTSTVMRKRLAAVAEGLVASGVSVVEPTSVWVPGNHPLFERLLDVEVLWAETAPAESDHPGWPERFDERYLVVVRPGPDGGRPEVANLLRVVGTDGRGEDGLFGLPALDQLVAVWPDVVTADRLIAHYQGRCGVPVACWQSIECSMRTSPGPGTDGDRSAPTSDTTLLAYLEFALDAEERALRSTGHPDCLVFGHLNVASVRSLARFGADFGPVLGVRRASTWCRWQDGRFVPHTSDPEFAPMCFVRSAASSAGFADLRPARLPRVELTEARP